MKLVVVAHLRTDARRAMSYDIEYIFEIARDRAEAQELERSGCGYASKESAERALRSPEIDNFYRNQLKVWKVKTTHQCGHLPE
jgi:hypothetical protein